MKRVVTSIFLAFLAFVAFSWLYTHNFTVEKAVSEPLSIISEIQSQLQQAPSASLAPELQVQSYQPGKKEDERPFDSQEDSYESAEIPERLRHPERSFNAGFVQTENEFQDVAQKAFQLFGPDFAQNSNGSSPDEFVANDTTMPTSYSEI